MGEGVQLNLYNGDCLERMKDIPDRSIDLILCDLPYGTTACKWDTIIPFDKLWEEYNRIVKDNGAIVLFSKQPFTTELIHSNLTGFKYSLVWKKDNLGRIWQHEVSKPYKLPSGGRMKTEIENKVIHRNADSDLI